MKLEHLVADLQKRVERLQDALVEMQAIFGMSPSSSGPETNTFESPCRLNLRVSSLDVVDESGKTKIWMNGGDSRCGARVGLRTEAGAMLEIQEQPSGCITLALYQNGQGMDVTIGALGVGVNLPRQAFGVQLGQEPGVCGELTRPGIFLCHYGKVLWQAPSADDGQ